MARKTRAETNAVSELERVKDELRRARAELARLRKRGNHTAPEKRRQIVALLRKGGMSDRAIAREVGVAPTTVGAIRRSLTNDGK